LLRVVPFQVKLREWPTALPLLTAAIEAVPFWLNGVLASPPPFPIPPGSLRFRLPDTTVPPLCEPETPLMSAAPSHPLTSLLRCTMPTRSWLMSRR
jgi:hypothetical protein